MKTIQLRALIRRYGTAGLMLVGVYLLVHHLWHTKRRLCLLAGGGMLLVLLSFCWLWKSLSSPVAVVSLSPVPIRPEETLDPKSPPHDIGIDAPRGINGDLTFSGQFYKWSGEFYVDEYGKEETLTEDGSERSYCIHPNGFREQIPFQNGDDSPSPDGARIASIRNETIVWIKPVSGQRITRVWRAKSTNIVSLKWSPDGKWLAITTCKDRTDYKAKSDLHLLHIAQQNSNQVYKAVEESVWSPEGRLYLRFDDQSAQIVQPETGKVQQVRDVIANALWLDDHRLLGNLPSDGYPSTTACCIGADGREQWRQTLTGSLIEDYEHRTYHKLPGKRNRLVIEGRHSMSDGPHFACGVVDLPTGRSQFIQHGALIGIAPDGTQIATADHNWVGPYKRGGERVGPLTLVSLKSGRTRKLTGPLGAIYSGEWKAVKTEPRLSRDRRLLRALEQGDAVEAQRLLAHGASPNAAFRNGRSALMIAAGEGMAETVSLLVEKGANIHATGKEGETALMLVCGYGLSSGPPEQNEDGYEYAPHELLLESQQRQIIKSLLSAEARVNAQDREGITALMLVAATGRTSLAALLLNHSHVNARDKNGHTPLMYAAEHGRTGMVRLLLKHGADPRLRTPRTEYQEGKTAASLAENYDHNTLATLLKAAARKR